MANYQIKHITQYRYTSTVIDCTNQILLYPIVDGHLEVRSHFLRITHDPAVETFTDYFGNHTGIFSIIKPHTSLVIESIAEVITKPLDFPNDQLPAATQWESLKDLRYHTSFIDFMKPEVFSQMDSVKSILADITDPSKTPLQNAVLLSEYVYSNFSYQKGITNVETKTEDVLKLKAGVCQDFAHILTIFLRLMGIPSRYVSGYICPKGKEMRGEGATHAWVEAYIPEYGWLGLDPTNNCLVNDQHVRLATGRNFADCTPVKGTYKGSGDHILEVSVEIKNGVHRTTPEIEQKPKFSYQAKNPGEPINTYRYYQEVQRKQQQQQQQQQQQ